MNILMNYGRLSDGDLQLVRDLMNAREDEERARPSAAELEEFARVKEQSQSTESLPLRALSLRFQNFAETDPELDIYTLLEDERGTDPSELVARLAANVFGHKDPAGKDDGMKLGYIRLLFVNAEEVDIFEHELREVCDASCQELADVYLALFGDSADPSPRLRGHSVSGEERICYIDTVFLEPQFRCRGLSLLVVDSIVKTFERNGADVIVLHAGAMTSVKHFTANGIEDQKGHAKRLTAHYGKLGFEIVRPRVEGQLGLPLMRFPQRKTFNRKDIRKIVPNLGLMMTVNLPSEYLLRLM